MAITDNTAKWQVKKITNFTDKSADIATQAQAEEGVDNTKMMTPLRVKQLGDKNYLKLTGGSVTGAIRSKGTYAMINDNTDGFIRIAGDPNAMGARISLAPASLDGYSGEFWLVAKNNTDGEMQLVGRPNGTLTWNNSEVITKTALGSQRPIKTYTSLEQLGLTNDATEVDIFNAMGANAELAFTFYQNSYPNFSLLNTIKRDGFIKFSISSLHRNSMLFMPSNEKYYYVGNVWNGNVVWDRVSSESEHRIKTYTSLEQLGLTNDATEVDIFNAMPLHSKLSIMFEVARYKNFVLCRYGSDGFIVFEKADYGVRSSIYFQPTNERRIITGSYFDNKLIYAVRYPNGNMPFGNRINIEVTNNGTTTYLCPCTGWIYVQVNTNSTYSSLRVQNNKRDYSVMTPNARSNTLISILLPCAIGDDITIYVEASTVQKAYFFSTLDEWGEYSV